MRRTAALCVVLVLAVGCDEEESGAEVEAETETETGAEPETDTETEAETDTDTDTDDGTGTGSGELSCDDAPVVTYDTFGRGFLSTYCDGCHAPAVVDRQGAPANVVFDTRDRAAEFADRILARSAPEGGAPVTMPPAGGIVAADIARLEIWLTCYRD